MRKLLNAGSFLAASLLATTAYAQGAILINYTGAAVNYTAPKTGMYQIEADGAQGADASGTNEAGLGAQITGSFTINSGDVLYIVVGGQGLCANSACGGGGATWVYDITTKTLLVVAGGGGASGFIYNGTPVAGEGGLTTQNATLPKGGQNGQGGEGSITVGGAGGGSGFLSAGQNAIYGGQIVYGMGGGPFPTLAGGATGGGFGGGGGGYAIGLGSSGGGGGYSGGGGGDRSSGEHSPGGGGGSWIYPTSIDQMLIADSNAGNGQVIITPDPQLRNRHPKQRYADR
jgi:hypothetical protein